MTDFMIEKKGVQMCRNEISGSADSADHHVEVAGRLTSQGCAITGSQSHFLGSTVCVGDQGTSGGFHDGHGTGSGSGGNAQGSVGFTQTVQATVLQNRSIASQEGIGDVAQHDFTVTQACSHLAVGVNATIRGGQAGVLAADAGNGVGNDAAGV